MPLPPMLSLAAFHCSAMLLLVRPPAARPVGTPGAVVSVVATTEIVTGLEVALALRLSTATAVRAWLPVEAPCQSTE
jgi:hypothetical protein